jgi:hypothetical protein
MTARKRKPGKKRQPSHRERVQEGTPRRAWFSSLSRGVKWLVAAVITAGAVATAIGAIAALWPDSRESAAELRAEISEVTVDRNVTLGAYTARQDEPKGSSAPTPPTKRQLVAFTLAQGGTVDTATIPTETETTPTETTPTETTPTETTPTETTPTETTPTETTPTDDEDGDDDIVVRPELSDEAETRLREGVGQALRDPAVVAPIDLGPACADGLANSDCGLSSAALYINWENEEGESAQVSQAEVAEQLVSLLTGTRMQMLPSGMRQPLGVTVNYRISLTGFRGRKVDVRWELHRPGGGQLPQDWLKAQRAALLEGEADKDSASPSFWVPLPAIEGPFFIRVTATDEDGVRLARKDTSHFR